MFGKKKKTDMSGQPVLRHPAPAPDAKKKVQMVPELTTLMYSDMGNRKYQQDAVYVTPSKRIAANKKSKVMAVVCDGMGGMTDGGLASRTAIEMMQQGFSRIEKMPDVNIPEFFRSGIIAIDRKVAALPKENGRGSGTTMVAVIAEDDELYWASVGDSRIYILRGNEMKQVTRDHNYLLRLQEMVASGQMTLEQAQAQKQKEALISFLGIGNVSLMDINAQPFQLQIGDVVLLCSDGIPKTLSDDRIQAIMQSSTSSLEEKARTLVMAAVRENTHSQDNTSVAILQYNSINIKERRL